jgi:hypothetical protein
MAVIVDTKQLQLIWGKWLTAERGPNIIPKYNYVSRKSAMGINFEDWIFKKGGIIMQVNGTRIIRFSDDALANWFLLEWS